MVNDLLFELGTEELPSAAVRSLSEELAALVKELLREAHLEVGLIRSFATPRRIAVMVHDLPLTQPAQTVSKRGPALKAGLDEKGQPTKALLGFARSLGVVVNDLHPLETEKGSWWVYETIIPAQPTDELLPALFTKAVSRLTIKKPMHWGEATYAFVRPVHWLVFLFGDNVIEMDLLGVKANRYTHGHRFHAPAPFAISHPRDYERVLEKAYVIADFNQRQQRIINEVQALADKQGYQAIMPAALVEEVTSIVEWPQALLASFSPAFLDVPAEALVASMQSHQKCFALESRERQLVPYFITVANIASREPQQVIAGNEKVMRARLSDADFFFHQDKKRPLAHRIEETKQVVFQAKLGSLFDKAARIQALMDYLSEPLTLNALEARRAAALSKCDLLTGMVGEFPELQGIMGYYYARYDKEEDAVAVALKEQYWPRFSADKLPDSALGLALSLADRIDTLVGIFAIGQKPSGVKDPFKLRRHALAVVRLLTTISAPIYLSPLIDKAVSLYANVRVSAEGIAALKPFILDRLHSFYQQNGVSIDVIHAVRARQDEWLFDTHQRIQAIVDFVQTPAAPCLSAACKRVEHLLAQIKHQIGGEVVPALLNESAEKQLWAQLLVVNEAVKPLYHQGNYGRILQQLAGLQPVVDDFFDTVMVMVDDNDVKRNRLNVLAQLQTLLQGVADISLLSC